MLIHGAVYHLYDHLQKRKYPGTLEVAVNENV